LNQKSRDSHGNRHMTAARHSGLL